MALWQFGFKDGNIIIVKCKSSVWVWEMAQTEFSCTWSIFNQWIIMQNKASQSHMIKLLHYVETLLGYWYCRKEKLQCITLKRMLFMSSNELLKLMLKVLFASRKSGCADVYSLCIMYKICILFEHSQLHLSSAYCLSPPCCEGKNWRKFRFEFPVLLF